MRFDLLMMALGLLLLLAMILTLFFGRDHSRHGYGLLPPKQIEPAQLSNSLLLTFLVRRIC